VTGNHQRKQQSGRRIPTATTDPADRREALLDEALQETFPASDPIAVSPDRTGPVRVRTRSAESGHALAKKRKKRAGSTHYTAHPWTWPRSPNK
jgi:hypothetical protein